MFFQDQKSENRKSAVLELKGMLVMIEKPNFSVFLFWQSLNNLGNELRLKSQGSDDGQSLFYRVDHFPENDNSSNCILKCL